MRDAARDDPGAARRIEIVEPTFESASGHCRSFLAGVCRAAAGSGWRIRVWGGKGARLPEFDGRTVEVMEHFSRRFRRLQAVRLYRELLSRPGRIFVATAGRVDLQLLSLVARGTVPPAKAFLYVHWIRPSPGKESALRRIAGKQPNLVVLGPTETVAEVFRRAGFSDVRVVPYPYVPVRDPDASPPAGFSHLVYAGGARQDKGFSRVVDLVARLAETGSDLPVVVQASPDHYERYDAATRKDLERLKGIRYAGLRVIPETLAPDAYARIYDGAVCLQPYAREDFADRVSGVTLDAQAGGAPVIATAGTWMARVAARFGGGIAAEDLGPESLLRAARAVRDDYPRYRERAREAGRALRGEHDPAHLFRALTE